MLRREASLTGDDTRKTSTCLPNLPRDRGFFSGKKADLSLLIEWMNDGHRHIFF